MPLVKFRLFVEGRSIDIDVFLAESAYQQAMMARRQCHAVAGREAWFVSPVNGTSSTITAAMSSP